MLLAIFTNDNERKNVEEMVIEAIRESSEIEKDIDKELLTDFITLVVCYMKDIKVKSLTNLVRFLYRAFTIEYANGEKKSVLKEEIRYYYTHKSDGANKKVNFEQCEDVLDKVTDELTMQALYVIKWDAEKNLIPKIGDTILNDIPDKTVIKSQLGKQWRVLMSTELGIYDFEERNARIRASFERFEKEEGVIANRQRILALFYASYLYLLDDKPESRTYTNVIKLVYLANKNSPGIQPSRLGRILMQKYDEDHVKNKNYKPLIEKILKLSSLDIQNAFEFILWEIMDKDPIDKDEILGYTIQIQNSSNEPIYMNHEDSYIPATEVVKLTNDMTEKYMDFVKKFTPEDIKDYLDQYIIGQDSAKENIGTAVYNHVLRGLHPESKLAKSNVLLIGPSGCGKTEIIRRLQEMFTVNNIDIPIVISDFSGVVATPWRGRNKEEILVRLYEKSGQNIEKTQHGIVFLDEFDKIVPKIAGGERGYDYNTELQGQMLGMLEGTTCEVKLNGTDNKIMIRTDNILFILAGAFDGLDKIIHEDIKSKKETVFGMVSNKKSKIEYDDDNVTIENLMKYGLRAELAGRVGYVSILKTLTKDDMVKILKEGKDNAISRYRNAMLTEDNIDLEFEEDAYYALAEKVQELGIGARGLNAVLHDVLADVMFKAPSLPGIEKVIITAGKVRGESDAIYVSRPV